MTWPNHSAMTSRSVQEWPSSENETPDISANIYWEINNFISYFAFPMHNLDCIWTVYLPKHMHIFAGIN
jgi:hypothetical protein